MFVGTVKTSNLALADLCCSRVHSICGGQMGQGAERVQPWDGLIVLYQYLPCFLSAKYEFDFLQQSQINSAVNCPMTPLLRSYNTAFWVIHRIDRNTTP